MGQPVHDAVRTHGTAIRPGLLEPAEPFRSRTYHRLCRPDLVRKIWIGALLFVAYYVVFLLGVEWTAPGYIERVWNMAALSNLTVFGMPIEELLFAAAFGAYWSGIYEHFTWKTLTPR